MNSTIFLYLYTIRQQQCAVFAQTSKLELLFDFLISPDNSRAFLPLLTLDIMHMREKSQAGERKIHYSTILHVCIKVVYILSITFPDIFVPSKFRGIYSRIGFPTHICIMRILTQGMYFLKRLCRNQNICRLYVHQKTNLFLD